MTRDEQDYQKLIKLVQKLDLNKFRVKELQNRYQRQIIVSRRLYKNQGICGEWHQNNGECCQSHSYKWGLQNLLGLFVNIVNLRFN